MIIGLIIVPGEEKYLEKSSGDEYVNYKNLKNISFCYTKISNIDPIFNYNKLRIDCYNTDVPDSRLAELKKKRKIFTLSVKIKIQYVEKDQKNQKGHFFA